MKHEQRTYLSQYLDVYDLASQKQLGFLADVSAQGLMFVSQQSLPLNHFIDICIKNTLVAAGEPPVFIKLQIETVWQKPNINPKLRCVGCRIQTQDNEAYEQLQALAKTMSFEGDFEIHRTCSCS